MRDSNSTLHGYSRRDFMRTGLSVAGGLALPTAFATRAFAEDRPPIGTWPAGSSGDSVFIGITVPRTGAYALQGEDELKGYQLAVEHINDGHPLIKKISPKTTKGVLGKTVKFGVADSAGTTERCGLLSGMSSVPTMMISGAEPNVPRMSGGV